MAASLAVITGILLCNHVTSGSHTDDVHGGVQMGVPSHVCDDGKINISIDWDPRSTEEFTCLEDDTHATGQNLYFYHCDEKADKPLHKCLPERINYTDDLPTSGAHRPLWPVYGEYKYVPPQRWLHSLEHGGLVFLYHPCADPAQIKAFKSLARECLHRQVTSPYKKLPPGMNFAVLAWMCKLTLSDVQEDIIARFAKVRALRGPEVVSADGQYSEGLIRRAKFVTDLRDYKICPHVFDLDNSMHRLQAASKRRRNHNRTAQKRLQSQMAKLLHLQLG